MSGAAQTQLFICMKSLLANYTGSKTSLEPTTAIQYPIISSNSNQWNVNVSVKQLGLTKTSNITSQPEAVYFQD